MTKLPACAVPAEIEVVRSRLRSAAITTLRLPSPQSWMLDDVCPRTDLRARMMLWTPTKRRSSGWLALVAATFLVAGPARAQQMNPSDENCTTTTDSHHNTVTQCGHGNSVTFGGGRTTSFVPAPGAAPPPAEWGAPSAGGQPVTQQQQAVINLVGRWTYTTQESGLQEEVIISFQPNGIYNQFYRFPQSPLLGNQIVQVWGQYQLGNGTLTTTPAGAQVSNGPDPRQLCNLQSNRCSPRLPMEPATTPLQQIDNNTIQTPIGMATRLQ